MQKSKNISIFILVVICVYSLFSQFYLKQNGNTYIYLINPLFFIIMTILLRLLVNTPYNSNKFKKNSTLYVIIAALAYMFIYLVSGLFLTYGKNPYSISIKGLLLNLYSIGTIIFAREYIRYKIINNVHEKDKMLIFTLTVIVFSLQELSLNLLVENFNFYILFKTVSMTVIPELIKNSLFTYIALYANYIPAIFYDLIINVFLWISPVLPNAPWIITAIMDSAFPLILLYYLKYEVSITDIRHKYKMKKFANPNGSIVMVVLVVLVIFWGLGYFPIKPIGIASGSMYPCHSIGDLVFIKKCKANEIQIGDIIEYKRKDFSVIHRVVDKYIKDEKIYFITKGDNNSKEDSDEVKEEQIVGKVIGKVPYIAYPAIWLKNISSSNSNVDVQLGN